MIQNKESLIQFTKQHKNYQLIAGIIKTFRPIVPLDSIDERRVLSAIWQSRRRDVYYELTSQAGFDWLRWQVSEAKKAIEQL